MWAAILALCLAISVGIGFAQEVTLAWDAPTTNVDGTPLTDLAGYHVYMNFVPITRANPERRIATVAAGTLMTSVDVGEMPEGGATVYFRATAYDTSGNESALSNEASRDFLPPSTITIRFQ